MLHSSAASPRWPLSDCCFCTTTPLPWGQKFVRWYNFEHLHSGIRYVTPAQRHAGEDVAILAARHQTYLQARNRHPARWSGATRDWSHLAIVTLNPERDSIIRRHLQPENNPRLTA